MFTYDYLHNPHGYVVNLLGINIISNSASMIDDLRRLFWAGNLDLEEKKRNGDILRPTTHLFRKAFRFFLVIYGKIMSLSVAKALCVENRIVILGRPTKDNGFHLDSVGRRFYQWPPMLLPVGDITNVKTWMFLFKLIC